MYLASCMLSRNTLSYSAKLDGLDIKVNLSLHIKVARYQVLMGVIIVQGVGLVSYCDRLSYSDDLKTVACL